VKKYLDHDLLPPLASRWRLDVLKTQDSLLAVYNHHTLRVVFLLRAGLGTLFFISIFF
jgi:hypothetical protein